MNNINKLQVNPYFISPCLIHMFDKIYSYNIYKLLDCCSWTVYKAR